MPRTPHHRTRHLLLALLAAGGCADQDASPVAPEHTAEAMAPQLPALPHVSFTTSEHETLVPAAPARADTDITDGELESRPLQEVFNPRTTTGIAEGHGYVYAIGLHDYIGNMGAIATTAHAAFQDQHLGSYTAERQEYTPFLLDLGVKKGIWATARVYTDKTCGLTALGDSQHSAWWQFFQGRSAPQWGVSKRYSQAQPTYQKACGSTTTTTHTGGDGSTTGMICYVLITWDLDTGQIVDTRILACTGIGDDRW